jgi:hypothetical protein
MFLFLNKIFLHLFFSFLSLYTQWQCILSYENITAMYRFLKTLHHCGIRTRDLRKWIENVYFIDILNIYGNLVCFMALWCSFSRFGMLHQVKSGIPAAWNIHPVFGFRDKARSGKGCSWTLRETVEDMFEPGNYRFDTLLTSSQVGRPRVTRWVWEKIAPKYGPNHFFRIDA